VLRTGLLIGSRLRKELARLQLTPPQWDVLCVLGQASPQGVMLHEISERLLVTCGNTTGIVDRLEEAGLVARTPHPEDRRAILAVLTERGRELYVELKPVLDGHLADLLGGLTPAQRRSAIELLHQIAAHVERVQQQAASPPDGGGE
jgi:DNA-binding MarR family transcriptional regulator